MPAAGSELSAANERVLAVWEFCGGWKPDLLPLAVAWCGVEDADFLIGQLILMRDRIADHARAQRAANGTAK